MTRKFLLTAVAAVLSGLLAGAQDFDQAYRATEFASKFGADIYSGSVRPVWTGDDTFDPEGPVTRATVITVLYRIAGSPAVTGDCPFTDLTDNWYKAAVQWAYETGVTNGTSDTTFSPDKDITLEQLVTLFYRFEKETGGDVSKSADLSTYPNADSIHSWAKDAVGWAAGMGVVNPVLVPDLRDVSSRAILAAALMILGK